MKDHPEREYPDAAGVPLRMNAFQDIGKETDMKNTSRKIGILQMIACAVLWSLGGLLIKYVDMNPFVIAGGRSILAAGVVLVYMLVKKQRFVLSKKTALSGIFLCLLFICFVAANKNTTAANAIVIQYTSPVFIVLLSAIFLHKKPRAMDLAAIFAILSGIVVFFLDGIDAGRTFGNLLALLAGIAMAGLFVTVGNTAGEEKMSGILLGHLLCAAVGLPFLAFTENTFDMRGVICLFVLGIVQIGIPYVLYALASERCTPISCSIIAMIEPILNPVLVAIFNHEIPSPTAICSGIFIVLVITAYSVWDAGTAKD